MPRRFADYGDQFQSLQMASFRRLRAPLASALIVVIACVREVPPDRRTGSAEPLGFRRLRVEERVAPRRPQLLRRPGHHARARTTTSSAMPESSGMASPRVAPKPDRRTSYERQECRPRGRHFASPSVGLDREFRCRASRAEVPGPSLPNPGRRVRARAKPSSRQHRRLRSEGPPPAQSCALRRRSELRRGPVRPWWL